MMYRPTELNVPLVGDLGKKFSVGFNLSNLGPKLTYIDAAQADPLPTNFRLGFGYKIFDDEYNSLTASLDFSRLLVRRRPAVVDSSGKVITAASVDGLPKALFTAWGDNGFKKVITSAGLEYWYGAPKLIALRIGYFYEDPKFGNRKFLTFGAGSGMICTGLISATFRLLKTTRCQIPFDCRCSSVGTGDSERLDNPQTTPQG